MRTLFHQVIAVICVFLQIKTGHPCFITGPIANCAFKNLHSIPTLPAHITHLFLEMNRISEITADSLSNLPMLQRLDLGHQHVPLVIRNSAFSQQRNLTRLVLGYNRGLQLEPLAFVGLSNLKYLDLDYCALDETILNGKYLEPLTALETLNLFGNNIRKLQPAMHFINMRNLTDLNLKLNSINQICEEDMVGFKGKHFKNMDLNSVRLSDMSKEDFDWEKCGNPFKDISFEMLDLSGNNLSLANLKHFFNAIQGTKLTKLKLSGHYGRGFSFNNLPDPDNSTFEGLNDSEVQTLDLSRNRIFELQKLVFSPFRNVEIIDISQNKINQIDRNAFEGLEGQLQQLNLSHNLLGEIYSHTFASLTNLKELDLSHNHIGALGYNSFSGLPNLKALFLTGNSIRDLGFPAILPKLDYLILGQNKLKSVYGITRFANNISYLDLSKNRLTNLGDVYMFVNELKHLEKLFYRDNPISLCVKSSQIGPNKLKVLYLDRISLQALWSSGRCLDIFDNLEYLKLLNLSSNGLQTLPSGIFKGPKEIKQVDLSCNALTYLKPDIFPKNLEILTLADNFIAEPPPEAFKSLLLLSLRMNRFYCGPDLMDFVAWIKQNSVTWLSPVEELRCEFPSRWYGVSLLDFYAQAMKQ